MNDKLNGRTAPTDDTRGLVRSELRAVDEAARAALSKTTERATKAHLEDVHDQIAKILDPKFAAAVAGGAGGGGGQGGPGVDDADALDGCWPDYAITLKRR